MKHDHKDAILSVREVDRAEYLRIYQANDDDPYMHCKNVQEQRRAFEEIYDRILPEKQTEEALYQSESRKAYYAGKTQVKNVRRFMRNQCKTAHLSTVFNAADAA